MKAFNISKNEKGNKSKIKAVNHLENIKSKFILSKIFNYLQKSLSFEIIKYNKKTQKRFNLTTKDYKELSEIEIVITPSNQEGNYINSPHKNDESYYHIFDKNKKIINTYYLNAKNFYEKINIIIDHQVNSISQLFQNCKAIKSIDYFRFNRRNIFDLSNIFFCCSSLKEINLSNMETINIKNMKCFFRGCSQLRKINLSNFKTNNAKDMHCMFEGCSSLKELDLSNFNTSNVTDMSFMFYGCCSLQKLNLSSFDTFKVTNMKGMFSGCSSLKELNLDNFVINKRTNIYNMFYHIPDELINIIRSQNELINEKAFK